MKIMKLSTIHMKIFTQIQILKNVIYTFEQVQEQKGLVSYRIPYFSLLLFLNIFFIISLEKLININKINNHLKTINFKNKIK